MVLDKPPWRNWLARSAVNRKVGGSSPPGGDYFSYYLLFFIVDNQFFISDYIISVFGSFFSTESCQ